MASVWYPAYCPGHMGNSTSLPLLLGSGGRAAARSTPSWWTSCGLLNPRPGASPSRLRTPPAPEASELRDPAPVAKGD